MDMKSIVLNVTKGLIGVIGNAEIEYGETYCSIEIHTAIGLGMQFVENVTTKKKREESEE